MLADFAAVAKELLPTGQFVQFDEPADDAKEPPGQALQLVAPGVSAKVPSGHGVHTDTGFRVLFVAFQKCPFGQQA